MNQNLNIFIEELKRFTKPLDINFDGDRYLIEYRIIKGKGNDKSEPFLLMQGFYWGLAGITELAYYLWELTGRDIILLSLPGYGNSSDPNGCWACNDDGVDQEAKLVKMVLDRLSVSKVVLVGHSMGAVIVSTLIDIYSTIADTIFILSPACLVKRATWIMPFSLLFSQLKLEIRKRNIYWDSPRHAIRREFQERGPFNSWKRIKLRWSEYMRLAYDTILIT